MSGTFTIEVEHLATALQAAKATTADKKDPAHNLIALVPTRDEDDTTCLTAIGYDPAGIIGAYTVPITGTLHGLYQLPPGAIDIILVFLKRVLTEGDADITIRIESSGAMVLTGGASNLRTSTINDEMFDYDEALRILRGEASADEVIHPSNEAPLPAGKRFVLSPSVLTKLNRVKAAVGEVAFIPTHHPASWVLMDSSSELKWHGAVLGAMYHPSYPTDGYATPLPVFPDADDLDPVE